jgi:hypothetical protein
MVSDEELSRRVTNPGMPQVAGNVFFLQAARTLGMDEGVAKQVLADVLLARGIQPAQLTRDQLRVILPEVEKRLHVVVNDELTGAIMRALDRFLGPPPPAASAPR